MPGRSEPMKRHTRLRSMSNKRRRENRVRRKVAEATFGLQPVCVVPRCGQWADDAHEPLTRARGGSITDAANMAPLCRFHNGELADKDPAWAYEIGLLKHSWDAVDDGTVRLPASWDGAE